MFSWRKKEIYLFEYSLYTDYNNVLKLPTPNILTIKIAYANSVDPDQTAPSGAV